MLYITESHQISLNLTKTHRISQILIKSCQISLYLTKSHHIFSNLIKCTKSQWISPFVAISHWILQNLTITHWIIPYFTDYHQSSPKINVTVGLQWHSIPRGGGVFFLEKNPSYILLPPPLTPVWSKLELKVYEN